ncbi:hypothetical protein [Paraburkholderia humisilvae]|uniref:Uncharacterized protein n=1 Tax=Paraburkholderia humisilvae TaxID=627669 RepID=A0A6J5F9G3_9BURK|nr:hypothetical protein [Paraburkholderia humisilvae]CAB3774431.1 hypothetical protein LMG29542_07808 [Paraburkholderia humisilvae]
MNILSGCRILHHPAVIGITIYLAEVLTRTDNSLAAALLVIAAMLVSRSIICLRRLFMIGARNRDVHTWDTVAPIRGKTSGPRV